MRNKGSKRNKANGETNEKEIVVTELNEFSVIQIKMKRERFYRLYIVKVGT